MTTFCKGHPGGEQAILDCAGTDATEAFERTGHQPKLLRILPPSAMVGVLERLAETRKTRTSSSFSTKKKTR